MPNANEVNAKTYADLDALEGERRERLENALAERSEKAEKIKRDFAALSAKEKHAILFKKIHAAIKRATSMVLDAKTNEATVYVSPAELPVNASISERSHLQECGLLKLEMSTFELVNHNEIEPLLGEPLKIVVLAAVAEKSSG